MAKHPDNETRIISVEFHWRALHWIWHCEAGSYFELGDIANKNPTLSLLMILLTNARESKREIETVTIRCHCLRIKVHGVRSSIWRRIPFVLSVFIVVTYAYGITVCAQPCRIKYGGNRSCSEIIRDISGATNKLNFSFWQTMAIIIIFQVFHRRNPPIRSPSSASCTEIILMSMNWHNKWIRRLSELASHAFDGMPELHVDL